MTKGYRILNTRPSLECWLYKTVGLYTPNFLCFQTEYGSIIYIKNYVSSWYLIPVAISTSSQYNLFLAEIAKSRWLLVSAVGENATFNWTQTDGNWTAFSSNDIQGSNSAESSSTSTRHFRTDPSVNWTAAIFPQIEAEIEKIVSSQVNDSDRKNTPLSFSLKMSSSGIGWLFEASKMFFLIQQKFETSWRLISELRTNFSEG